MSDKTCSLEYQHARRGPIKYAAALTLTNEFNNQFRFRTKTIPRNDLIRRGLFFVKAFLAVGIANSISGLIQHFTGLNASDSSVGSVVEFALKAAVAFEAASITPSRLERFSQQHQEKVASFWAPKPAEESFEITREEYDYLKTRIPQKTHIWSPMFNNCVQQTRREFRALKQEIIDKRECVTRSPMD